MDFWQVLPVALALVLIIEGAMPFISPNRWRNMLAIGTGSLLVAREDGTKRLRPDVGIHRRGAAGRPLLLYDRDLLLHHVLRERTSELGRGNNARAQLLLEVMTLSWASGRLSTVEQETVIATQGKEITRRVATLAAN